VICAKCLYLSLCIEISGRLHCKTNHEFFTRNGYTSRRTGQCVMLSKHNLAEMQNIEMYKIVNVVAVVVYLICFLIWTSWVAGLVQMYIDGQG
jgi:hypothetical protein